MAKTLIVKLSDDIDGGDADETVRFALDGKVYEIDLSAANAAKLRGALKLYIDKGRAGSGSASRAGVPRSANSSAPKTLYAKLSDDEKARFRAWSNMATARRISDARVNNWVEAGKP
jgi:hypothetical protein